MARLGSGHQLGTHTNVNFGTRYMQKITFGGTQQYQNQNTKQAKIIIRPFVVGQFLSQFVSLFGVLLSDLNMRWRSVC